MFIVKVRVIYCKKKRMNFIRRMRRKKIFGKMSYKKIILTYNYSLKLNHQI